MFVDKRNDWQACVTAKCASLPTFSRVGEPGRSVNRFISSNCIVYTCGTCPGITLPLAAASGSTPCLGAHPILRLSLESVIMRLTISHPNRDVTSLFERMCHHIIYTAICVTPNLIILSVSFHTMPNIPSFIRRQYISSQHTCHHVLPCLPDISTFA